MYRLQCLELSRFLYIRNHFQHSTVEVVASPTAGLAWPL